MLVERTQEAIWHLYVPFLVWISGTPGPLILRWSLLSVSQGDTISEVAEKTIARKSRGRTHIPVSWIMAGCTAQTPHIPLLFPLTPREVTSIWGITVPLSGTEMGQGCKWQGNIGNPPSKVAKPFVDTKGGCWTPHPHPWEGYCGDCCVSPVTGNRNTCVQGNRRRDEKGGKLIWQLVAATASLAKIRSGWGLFKKRHPDVYPRCPFLLYLLCWQE